VGAIGAEIATEGVPLLGINAIVTGQTCHRDY
jgi:hypothetical protein